MQQVHYGLEHATVSNIVADALDRGEIPWRLNHLPTRATTGWAFGGVNPLLLNIAARRLGLTSPIWGTVAEWHSLRCKVLQPDRAAQVFRAHPPAQEAVHNLEQTNHTFTPPTSTQDDPADVLDSIVHRAGVVIHFHFGTKCIYCPAEDCIKMPEKLMFLLGPGGETGYADAAAHELFHWTESRVGWQASYEVSELRAEIGSGFMLGALGVLPLPLHLARHHRRFAPAWSVLLRSRPSLLFRIVNDVIATLNWLLCLIGRKIAWEDVALSPAVVTSPGTFS